MKKNLKYIIAIILIIIFAFSIVPRQLQNDTFYIIELGRQIQKTGVDWKDHWSIHDNLEYRYPHWLFDLINANIYEAFGFNGIYVFTQIFASALLVLIFINLIKKDISLNLAFIGTITTGYLMRIGFCDRGQIISYLIFFIEYMILERFVLRPTFFKTLGLFILSCLMANIHSTAWIMMLVLLLPFVGEKVVYMYSLKGVNEIRLKRNNKALEKAKLKGNIKKVEKLEKEIKDLEHFKEIINNEKAEHKIIITNNPNAKYLWIAFVALILGALVTPIKLTPFVYYLKISAGNSMPYINEHQPIVIASDLQFMVYTIIIVALIGFTKEKIKLSDAFLILGLYLMTISSRRNIFLLLSLTCCILIGLIDHFIKSNIEKENKKFSKVIFIIFSISSVILSGYVFIKNYNVEFVSKNLYPVDATKYIKENLDYKNIRMYNRYDYGSYLLMNDVPVFIDSRCDLYTPEFNKKVNVFKDTMDIITGNHTISTVMDKYNLSYALLPVDELEDNYIKEDDRYTELYRDDYFVVYEYESK